MMRIVRALAWSAIVAIVLLAIAGGGLYCVSQRRLDRTWHITAHALSVPADSLAVDRGRHLATAIARCADCHRADFGGGPYIDAPLRGRLHAANLTRGKGGIGGQYSDLDWERAIRHGVKPDGSALLFMPSVAFQHLGDEDTAALIAYLKTLPPVDREPAANSVGPIARALLVHGDLALLPAEAIDHAAAHASPVPMSASAEYGRYLARIGGCEGCHGPGHYSEEDFFRALREGKRPDGTPLDSLMPYRFTRQMTDDEIRALFLYLKTVKRRR